VFDTTVAVTNGGLKAHMRGETVKEIAAKKSNADQE
jgi:hypothetical protein